MGKEAHSFRIERIGIPFASTHAKERVSWVRLHVARVPSGGAPFFFEDGVFHSSGSGFVLHFPVVLYSYPTAFVHRKDLAYFAMVGPDHESLDLTIGVELDRETLSRRNSDAFYEILSIVPLLIGIGIETLGVNETDDFAIADASVGSMPDDVANAKGLPLPVLEFIEFLALVFPESKELQLFVVVSVHRRQVVRA